MTHTIKSCVTLIYFVMFLAFAHTSLYGQVNGYAYQRVVVINRASVVGSEQSFPVLVSGTFPDLATVPNGGKVQNEQGYDIVFASDTAGQNTLPFEQESYSSATGAINYWVQVPALSDTSDTVIYMFYGNASVTTDQSNRAAVWDQNFKGVWHFGDGSTLNSSDSTANGNNGTVSGAISAIAGKIGGAAAASGGSNTTILLPTSATPDNSAFTYSFWFNSSGGGLGVFRGQDGYGSGWSAVAQVASNFIFAIVNSSPSQITLTSNAAISPGVWYHVAAVWSPGSGMKLYLNGALDSSNTDTSTVLRSSTRGVQLADGFNGLMDEVEISNSARSADWIATEYNNQNSPGTFAVACPSQVAGSASGDCLRPAPTAYSYVRPIALNHSEVSNTDQQDFPVLVSGTYADLANIAYGGTVHNLQGYDIIFTSDSAGQNVLDHEIDTYDPTTGTVNFWVRIPTLSHTNDMVFYMWYGNSAVMVSQENKPGAWRNGFASVYHFGNGNSLSGSDSAGTSPGINTNVSAAAGLIGGAGYFGTSSVITATPSNPVSGSFTIEEWARPTATSGALYSSRAPHDEGFDSSFTSWGVHGDIGSGETWLTTSADAHSSYSTNVWHHYVYSVTNSAYSVYQDAILVGSGTFSGTPLLLDSNHYLHLGGNYSGLIDEARVSTVARSTDWITTEYNNQSSPSAFATVCPGQAVGTTIGTCTPFYPLANTYNNSRVITINHLLVSNSDQVNFPVLISGTYPDLANVANGGKVQSPQGYDIVFTSDAAGQNRLDHEIDTYNPATGAINFWVRLPLVSHSGDTTIYMWYGNASVLASQENKPGVWSNGYVGVYHLGNGTGTTGFDSTGTNSGAVGGSPINSPIGGGVNFDGTGSQYMLLWNSASLKPTSALTLEAWVNPTAVGSWNKVFSVDYHADSSWYSPYQAYSLSTAGGGPNPVFQVANNDTIYYSSVGPALPLSAWTHLVGTFDGQSMHLFVNGVGDAAGVPVPGNIDYGTSNAIVVGKDSIYNNAGDDWNGKLDELRISNVARSADWIATEYNNQNSPETFASISGESPAVAPPQITGISPTTVAVGSQITINGSNFGGAQQSGTVVLNNVLGTVVSWTGTQIMVTVPQGTSPGSLYVQQNGVNSNAVPFTWNTPFVANVSPENGARSVSPNSSVVVTFNEAIDPNTVNSGTLPITVTGIGGVSSGEYSFDSSGKVVTFTPSAPFPGNATVNVQVANNGVADLAGNHLASAFASSFTTGPSTDTTPPQVVSVTPNDGATAVASNSTVVLTFSESINPATVTSSTIGLLVHGASLGPAINISADNRTVTLNAFSLPANTSVAVVATSGITDWSGNPLVDFQSQFTTGINDTNHPYVATQRPGNGATGAPVNSSIVLYFNEPMNAGSVQGAVQVTQNGNAVTGTLQLADSGQVATFTPTAPFPFSANVQVSVGSGALDLDGNSLYPYQSSFTTVVDTTAVSPQLIASNPATGASSAPTNVVMELQFNEPIDATKLTGTSVLCQQNGGWIQTALTLLGDGSLLQVTPRFQFAPNASIRCNLDTSITGTNGLQYSGSSVSYNIGSSPDNTPPTISFLSPPNGWTNIGDNAYVRLIFSEPINPLSVNANTVQLSGGGSTFVPDSISFTNNNQSVMIVPHAPMPDSTVMTLTINGVADLAGNAVAPQTTQFTTGVGPDLTQPAVIAVSPYDGQTNVPTNAVVTVQLNKPIDPSTVSGSGINVDYNGQLLPGTPSVSADGETISFLPVPPLPANASMSSGWGSGITDLAGNTCCTGPWHANFQTGVGPNATTPQVVQVSPASGTTGLPTNLQIVIQFNEPVNGAKLGGVTLSSGSGTVSFTESLTNGNQTLRLIPIVPLAPNTAYTLNISGLQDLSGNAQGTPFSATYQTGAGADLNLPKVTNVTPGSNASGVAITSTIQVQFNKPIDSLTVTNATFQVVPSGAYQPPIAGSIAVSTDGISATFTPSSPLDSLTTYVVNPSSAITDLEGQSLQGLSYQQGVFTTAQVSSGLAPSIETLPYGQAGSVGQSILINGMYFGTSQGSSTVTFNGVAASISSWSDSQIQAQVPSGATTGPLVVTVNGQPSNGVTYQIIYTPAVTSLSLTSAAPGMTLTITGSNFGSPSDTTQVFFNNNTSSGVSVTPISWTENTITVVVPSSARSGNLWISVDGYQSNFSYLGIVVVTSVTPTSGVAGGQVVVNGAGFGSSQGSGVVYFNGVPAASISNWQDGYIAAVPPANVTTGPVTVVQNSTTSNSTVVFIVIGPSLGSITPPAAAPGATVTIAGSNLAVSGANIQVLFNGVPGSIPVNYYGQPIVTDTGFTATVPQNATTGPVTVTIGGVTTNGLQFTVEQPPTITSISPLNGQAGSWPITIDGSGFGATQSNSSVNFFFNTSAQIISWSDTEIKAIVPNGTTTGFIYLLVGGLEADSSSPFTVNSTTDLTDSLGNQTNYNFSTVGGAWALSSSAGPGCSTCTVRGNIIETDDNNGNVLTHTDDLGHVTTYTYDSANDVTSSSQQLDANTPVATSYTYNSFGEVLTMTDALGNVTTNSYDGNGNLLSVTTPAPDGSTSASVTRFTYDTKGELTGITDPLNNPTTLTYTQQGLIASITDAQSNTTSYQYDARGNRIAVIDPVNGAGHPTRFAYDIMNRLTGITYPDGSSIGFGYDYRGRRISSTDQNGKTTTYTYDDADRLTSVTDPANNVTQYAYDTEGNLVSITDANNHTTNFAYNARGWVMQTTFPSTLAETYGYDAVGNLTSKTDRKGNTIQYVYDALNRLTQKSYPDSTGVDYVYDLVGKIRQVTDPTGVYGFAYDNMGRLIGTTTQYSFIPNQTFTNAYTYDAASNRKSLTAPDGSITTYGYDSLNRLNGLANSWAGSFGFGYDALSRRTSLTRPNGVNTNYTYDSDSRLLSVLHQAGTNVLDGASYTYDAAGNRASKTNYLNGVTSNYSYDPIYELTQVTQASSTTESYSYDAVGNRLSSLGVPSYQYNASNELTSSSLGSYAYDANGNTLTDSAGKQYSWDFENRLTSVTTPRNGTTAFRYDPAGRRIQKSGPLGTTNYLYDGDGDNAVEEVDASGNLIADYTQTQMTDELLSELRSGTTSYYLTDALDSITSLSNASGVLANTYTYDSFGRLTASVGSQTNPFQYTARDSDSETGLYYYRARYYDPTIGRFTSEDPTGFGDGINFFRYVHNNPLGGTDPSGLTSYQGFPPDLGVQMMNAVNEAIGKLKPQDCNGKSCAGNDGPKLINIIENATFVFQPKSKYCGHTGPASFLGVRHTFGIGPAAFGPTCCKLASTIVHEAVHGMRNVSDKKPDQIEKDCFGCITP